MPKPCFHIAHRRYKLSLKLITSLYIFSSWDRHKESFGSNSMIIFWITILFDNLMKSHEISYSLISDNYSIYLNLLFKVKSSIVEIWVSYNIWRRTCSIYCHSYFSLGLAIWMKVLMHLAAVNDKELYFLIMQCSRFWIML